MDRSSLVKRISADFFIREINHYSEENERRNAVKLAKIFAADKSWAVAERGQFALKKLNNEILKK